MKKLPKINTSKLLKAALPYILVGLMATKLGQVPQNRGSLCQSPAQPASV